MSTGYFSVIPFFHLNNFFVYFISKTYFFLHKTSEIKRGKIILFSMVQVYHICRLKGGKPDINHQNEELVPPASYQSEISSRTFKNRRISRLAVPRQYKQSNSTNIR